MEQVPNFFGGFAQRRIGLDSPAHGDAHEDSLDHARQVHGWNVAPDFAAFLRQQKNLRQDAAAHVAAFYQFLADGCAGSVRRENRAQQGGAFVGLAHGISHEFAKYVQHRPFCDAPLRERALHRGSTLAAEFRQNMLLGGEIVEKGPFSYIGRFGDVLHSRFQETALGEQGESGTGELGASFRAMAFAAAGAGDSFSRPKSRGSGSRLHQDTIIDYRASPTVSQHWTMVISPECNWLGATIREIAPRKKKRRRQEPSGAESVSKRDRLLRQVLGAVGAQSLEREGRVRSGRDGAVQHAFARGEFL